MSCVKCWYRWERQGPHNICDHFSLRHALLCSLIGDIYSQQVGHHTDVQLLVLYHMRNNLIETTLNHMHRF